MLKKILRIRVAGECAELYGEAARGTLYRHWLDRCRQRSRWCRDWRQRCSRDRRCYAGQNGRDYVAIGRLLRQRNLLAPGKATMAGIVEWIRTHPAEGKALMRENPSYIFFKEVVGAGPLGSLGVPVTGRTSIAVDPKFIPLGAPVLLELDRPEANGLWIAQDVGGAIKGANRVDTFWGAGAAAQATAGGMSASGRAWVLVPRGINVQAYSGAQPHP